jgi:RecA/RadA recombinase
MGAQVSRSKKQALKEEPLSPIAPSFAANRDHLKAMEVIAAKCAAWKPAQEVLVPVRAVPTIFPALDIVTRVGGWPIDRFSLIHGPSNEGKTQVCHGIGLSFLKRGHFYLYVDAEYTTPETWLHTIMSDMATHPGFSALRPVSYEQTVDAVRQFCETLQEAKDKGDIDKETSGLIVVDSLRKLVPKRLMAAIAKGVENETQTGPRKGKSVGVDGIGGRAGQYKAALNAAWLDELVPMLAASGVGMIAVARESEDPDAGMFGEGFKVGGGTAVYYDSSFVCRISRESYLKTNSEDKTCIIGEKHQIEVRKTKIGGKEHKRPKAYFHTSNGTYFKPGFCRAMDLVVLAGEYGIIEGTGWFEWEGHFKVQGLNAFAKRLEDAGDVVMDELESEIRKVASESVTAA